jgi:hypothetical protein
MSPTARTFLEDIGPAGVLRDLAVDAHHDAQRHAEWPADGIFAVYAGEHSPTEDETSTPWPCEQGTRLFRMIGRAVGAETAVVVRVRANGDSSDIIATLTITDGYGEIDFDRELRSREWVDMEITASGTAERIGVLLFGWAPSNFTPSGGLTFHDHTPPE